MMFSTLVALLVTAAAPEAVAIDVEGTGYTLSDVRLAVQEARARRAINSVDPVIEFLRAELLMAVDARRSGLAAAPETSSRVVVERTRALASLFVDAELTKGLEPTDAQLKESFHRASDSVRLRMAVYASAPDAEAALKRLSSGGSFAAEASKTVVPISSSPDGTTGPLTRADLDPAIASVAYEAPIGKLLGPIALKAGWAIAFVVARNIADEALFPSQRQVLASLWKSQAVGAVKAHFIENGRKVRPQSVDEKFLASTGARVFMAPEEAEHVVARVGAVQLKYRDLFPLIRGLSANREGGHTSGAVVKMMVIEQYLDDVLIAAAATDLGFASNPGVVRRLARVENRVLAMAGVEAFLATLSPSMPQPKRQAALNKHVETLGKKYRVTVDAAAMREAL